MIKIEIWNYYKTDKNTIEIEGLIRSTNKLKTLKDLENKFIKSVDFSGHKYTIEVSGRGENEPE